MRTLKYYLLHPIWPSSPCRHRNGAQIARGYPYLIITLIPPRSVLNSVLRKGSHDAGMSGGYERQPFEG